MMFCYNGFVFSVSYNRPDVEVKFLPRFRKIRDYDMKTFFFTFSYGKPHRFVVFSFVFSKHTYEYKKKKKEIEHGVYQKVFSY